MGRRSKKKPAQAWAAPERETNVPLFELPPAFLAPLMPTENGAGVGADAAEGGGVVVASTRSSCNTCGGEFGDAAAYRAHFASDWHTCNVRRRLAGQAALSLVDFATFERAMGPSGSSSSSDDEPDEDGGGGDVEEAAAGAEEAEEADEDQDQEDQDQDQDVTAEDGMIAFSLPEHSVTLWANVLGVPKRAEDLSARARAALGDVVRSGFRWVVLLFQSGHFAGATFERGVVGEHKTFHRYTVRRKAGGSQAARDATGNAPKSAGASLRRYNEAMLTEEVHATLAAWGPQLASADLIFLGCNKRSRHLFFGSGPLSKEDPRVRLVPFMTARPTFGEVQRVHLQLATACVRPRAAPEAVAAAVAEEEEEKVLEDEAPPMPPLLGAHSSSVLSAAAANSPETPLPSALTARLYRCCCDGDVAGAEAALAAEDEDDDDNELHLEARFDGGLTPLHRAAKEGSAALVLLLLRAGADPTARDYRDRVPYVLAEARAARDAFRQFRGEEPERWNYGAAKVPEPLADGAAEARREKQRLKRQRARQRRKEEKASAREGAAAEAAAAAEEARRAAEKEAGAARAGRCANCSVSLHGSVPFEALSLRFCTTDCVAAHRRRLAAAAAEARFG